MLVKLIFYLPYIDDIPVLENLCDTNIVCEVESIFREHAGDIIKSFKQLHEAKQKQQVFFNVVSMRLENQKHFDHLVINPSDTDKNRLQVTIRYIKKHNTGSKRKNRL